MFKAVIKSNIKRYWWIFVLNIVVLALGYIVPIFNDIRNEYTYSYWLNISMLLLLAAGFGTLHGWSLFAYMNSTKAVNLFHSLPSTRTKIFLGNLLCGGLATIIPGLIMAILIPAMTTGYKNVDTHVNFSFIFVNCIVIGLAFFAVACFTVMFSGNAVAGKVFTPIIIGLPFFLEAMFQTFRSEMLYGGSYSESFFQNMFLTVYPCSIKSSGAAALNRSFWAYLIVTVVALAGAYIAYRLRHMESAGEVVTVNWAKLLFVQGAALCFGIALTGFTINDIDNFPMIAIWGLVVAAAAMMILQKTYRIKGYIKQAVIYLCIVAVIFAGFKLDITGYEKRVPKAENVESMSIHDGNIYRNYGYYDDVVMFTDPEVIEKAVAAHKSIVADRPDEDGWYRRSIALTYKLKNGATLSREYQLDADGIKTYMGEVMMTEAYKNRCFMLDEEWLNVASDGREVYFTKDEINRIRTALAADVAAADFDTLYPMQRDYTETEPVSNMSIYVVLGYSERYGEQGSWLTIKSTLPNEWAAVKNALADHAVEIESYNNMQPGGADTELTDVPATESVEIY